MSALDNGRYSVAAGCVGICDGCVECLGRLREGAQAVRRPARPLPAGPGDDRRHDPQARRRPDAGPAAPALLKDEGKPNTTETSIAKLYATEAAVECANLAIQVHGGSGYVDDYPVERYLRDARVTTLYEGTSQIQKLIIGRARDRDQRDAPLRGELSRGDSVEVSVDEFHVGLLRLNRPEARNALSPEMMERDRRRARAPRRRPGGPLHRHRRLRRGLRRRRRHQGDGRAQLRRGACPTRAAGFWQRLAAIKTPIDRRRLRLRARRRLRAGAGLRHDRRRRDRRASASPRSPSGSSPAAAAPSAWRGRSASSGRWSTSSPAAASTPRRPTRWGLVNKVVDEAAPGSSEAIELARTVAERPPIAARLAKQAVLAAEETGARRRASRPSGGCSRWRWRPRTGSRGCSAFLEKREPEFKGR